MYIVNQVTKLLTIHHSLLIDHYTEGKK